MRMTRMRTMGRDNGEGKLSDKDMDKVRQRGRGRRGETTRAWEEDVEEGRGQGTTTTRDIRQ